MDNYKYNYYVITKMNGRDESGFSDGSDLEFLVLVMANLFYNSLIYSSFMGMGFIKHVCQHAIRPH